MNEKIIWDFLIGKIGNPFGVAGLMGNLYAESALNPTNLQGRYERKLGMTDSEYTAAVDNGSYANFVRDAAGYGLAQWTYWSRKQKLLDFARQNGKSIGDLNMQLEFLWNELTGYKTVMKTLLNAQTVREASDIVMTRYEKSANQSDSAKIKREKYGQDFFNKYARISNTAPGRKEDTIMSFDPQKVIQVALAEVGYLEKKDNSNLDDKTANAGNKNYTKYARDLDALGFYNGRKNGVAWCDSFADWCYVQAYGLEAALKLTCQPFGKTNCGAGCRFSRNYYKKKGQLFDKPQPGDQVFFYPKNGIGGSAIQHTGLVYAVDDKYVYTVEGNTSGANGVISNGGGVCKKKYALTYARLAGFGRPDWGMGDVHPTEEKTPETESTSSEFAAGTRIVVITGNSVNLRVGDSMKYGTTGRASKGTKLEYVATSPSGWFGVRLKDRICWVSNKYAKVQVA